MMNYKMMMTVVLTALLAGCASHRQNTPTTQTMPVQAPVKTVVTPKPTAKDREVKFCKDLWQRIQGPMIKHQYDKAREIALTGREKEDKDIASSVLVFRIGLVTSVINPAEMEWQLEKLSAEVDNLCKVGDFEKAYKVIDDEKKYWDDSKYTNADGVLDMVQKQLNELFYSNSSAKEYVGKYRKEIVEMLNNRSGRVVMRHDLRDVTIGRLEKMLKAEMPADQQQVVDNLIFEMRKELETRNMTTAQLETAVHGGINNALSEVIGAEEKVRKQDNANQNTLAKKLEALRVSVVLKQSIAHGGVDLKDEIAIMEEAAKRKSFGRGLLFGECAYGLRLLLANGKMDMKYYQDLLSASILLNRKPMMEMAVKCGADVNIVAPHDVAKTMPVILAIKVGDKSQISWLCEKGGLAMLRNKLAFEALKQAVVDNRLDLFKYLQNLGCAVSPIDNGKLFGIGCEHGSDNLHLYLASLGAKPTYEDFRKAVESDNVTIVKWFVEELLFDPNHEMLKGAKLDKAKAVLTYLRERGSVIL